MSSRWWGYLFGVGLIIVTTLLGEVLHFLPNFDPTNMDMFYVLVDIIAAYYFGVGPSIIVCVLGVLAFDLFFVPPVYTLAVATQQYAVNLLVLFVIGLVISFLFRWKRY